ncbi:hypothetical protein [Pedobacter sp. JCM 36344]|uniref:hypothetical protein n=1 Tax=Pedobacter sp. JCM 36344 TaxID=3374280 RepID=UPI0039793B2B
MRKIYCVAILCLFGTVGFAQNVAIVNGKAIQSKEFIWTYKKNHRGIANVSYEDLIAYLHLYINFKLKVLDAMELKLDKDTSYLAEVKKYETALQAQRRLSEKSAEYTFVMNEYKEAVLMFNISELKIWNKAQDGEAQLKLEQEWINALRNKYTIKVNQQQIKKMAKP